MSEQQQAAAPAAATEKCPVPPAGRKWLARLGVAGFLFFFIKGLLWLIVPALVVWMGWR